MNRVLPVILALGLAACHPGSTQGTNSGVPDEIVGTWQNDCVCLEFDQLGNCIGDLCHGIWERAAPRLLLVNSQTSTGATTLQADVSEDGLTLDLYWESAAEVSHMTLFATPDAGCP